VISAQNQEDKSLEQFFLNHPTVCKNAENLLSYFKRGKIGKNTSCAPTFLCRKQKNELPSQFIKL
jgi:hypothetical protein